MADPAEAVRETAKGRTETRAKQGEEQKASTARRKQAARLSMGAFVAEMAVHPLRQGKKKQEIAAR